MTFVGGKGRERKKKKKTEGRKKKKKLKSSSTQQNKKFFPPLAMKNYLKTLEDKLKIFNFWREKKELYLCFQIYSLAFFG